MEVFFDFENESEFKFEIPDTLKKILNNHQHTLKTDDVKPYEIDKIISQAS